MSCVWAVDLLTKTLCFCLLPLFLGLLWYYYCYWLAEDTTLALFPSIVEECCDFVSKVESLLLLLLLLMFFWFFGLFGLLELPPRTIHEGRVSRFSAIYCSRFFSSKSCFMRSLRVRSTSRRRISFWFSITLMIFLEMMSSALSSSHCF